MGFAKLTYATDGSIRSTTVLHDIVGVITGTFTSTSQLTGAIQAQSEIVNTINSNWSFLYPASGSFVPATPNVNLASWVLTAPCVNTSKTKYIRLTNYNTGNINQTGAVTGNIYNGGTSRGIILQGATSASTATTIVNGTFYQTNTSGNLSMLRGSQIFISWSNKHLILYSNLANSGTSATAGIMAYLEFPETTATQVSGATPAVVLWVFDLYLTDNGYTSPSGIGAQNHAILPDYYNISAASRGMANIASLSTAFDRLYSTAITNTFQPINSTINSAGSSRINIVPLMFSMLSKGYSPLYISEYSNMYLVAAGLGSPGDTISIGSDLYVYLPGGGSGTTSSPAYIIKKA
jgi:hypothetical protein